LANIELAPPRICINLLPHAILERGSLDEMVGLLVVVWLQEQLAVGPPTME
jgi:hypothetical protein